MIFIEFSRGSSSYEDFKKKISLKFLGIDYTQKAIHLLEFTVAEDYMRNKKLDVSAANISNLLQLLVHIEKKICFWMSIMIISSSGVKTNLHNH